MGSEAIDLERLLRTDLYADSELTEGRRSGANEFFCLTKIGRLSGNLRKT